MTTLLIDLVLGFWLLLFGGIALLPILTGRRSQPSVTVEDRVISIAPARPAAARTTGERAPLLPEREHHERTAA